MPPQNINYANTCIYKICCKDETIKDLYVGRTCDITRRKSQHKRNCNTQKQQNVYIFINLHGGWNNWEFSIIEEYPSNNSIDASDRENYWIIHLMASLNINIGIWNKTWLNDEYKKKWYFEHRHKIQEIRKNKKELAYNALSDEEKLKIIKI